MAIWPQLCQDKLGDRHQENRAKIEYKVGKGKGAGIPAPLSCLNFVYVGSLGALRTGNYIKGYTLAFFE